MFSGIVEGTGRVARVSLTRAGMRLTVALPRGASKVALGGSVAVDGVCLTVAAKRGSRVTFDVVAETLRKTTLGSREVGDRVNIERSLAAGQPIDGHFVQGHVEGVGTVTKRLTRDNDFQLTIALPKPLRKYVAPLGSVAVNGVSLTVAKVSRSAFTVALIPTTLTRTNLADVFVNDTVHIETDMIARQVVRYLEARHETA